MGFFSYLINRITTGMLVLAFMFFSINAKLFSDETPQIICRGIAPESGHEFSFVFTKGKPAVICAPRSQLRIFLKTHDNTPLFINSVQQIVGRLKLAETFKLSSPSNGIQFSTPAIPGDSEITINYTDGSKDHTTSIICITPYHASWSGHEPWLLEVEGFALGMYPDSSKSRIKKIRENSRYYTPPRFFGMITEKNVDSFISPNFRISDMLIPTEKTNIRHTQFFPSNYQMIMHMENILALFQRRSLPAKNIRILSAFRTPEYNQKIGSSKFSQHIYGNAFDFFFDGNNDGTMDDLDGDGSVTLKDARLVIDTIEEGQKKGILNPGGIGFYYFQKGSNPHRLTFHIDMRGYHAFWAYYHNIREKVQEIDWKSRYFPGKK